ncbi:7659_t:CDS:2, partial [Acaulospora morrowiae]
TTLELAPILVINLKHQNSYSYSYSDTSFQIHKELYMDRYLPENKKNIEEKWNQVEKLKIELERTSHQIDKIMKFQGKHSGTELLKGSIEHFRWKCSRAKEKGESYDDAERTLMWLMNVQERVERKFNALLEKKVDHEQNIKKIFDTQDMKKCLYRLKAVLVREGQTHWAYIWVPRDGKGDGHYTSTFDDGSWMKFHDTNVEKVYDDLVLNETVNNYHSNNTIYALIYVDHKYDHNYTNITDVIPASLKEFVNRDNRLFEDELQSQHRSQEDISESTVDIDHRTWGSDSTTYGTSDFDYLPEQARNTKSYQSIMLKRIELFGFKLGQIDVVKSLLEDYKDPSVNSLDWSEPIPLQSGYRGKAKYSAMVTAYDSFKHTTFYIMEGLEQSFQDQYKQGLGYLYQALELERSWVNDCERNGFNGTNLDRTIFINTFAKAFLKILNDGSLEKAKDPKSFPEGVENALSVLKICISFKFIRDGFLNGLTEGWVNLKKNIEEKDTYDRATFEKLSQLISSYKSSEIPYGLDIKFSFDSLLENLEPPKLIDDDSLAQRYTECLKKCKTQFKDVAQAIELI